MKSYFQEFQKIAESGNYAQLNHWQIQKPEFFNWTKEVFEEIHLNNHPDKTALILARESGEVQYFSYQNLADSGNQLLNLCRNSGVKQGNSVFVMIPICPELWSTYLASIKGGLVLIPTASIMSVKDLEYRFSKLLPEVVIADLENAAKIDEAAENLGKNIKLKLLVAGEKSGWTNFAEIGKEATHAEAAHTKADDALFLFFTSGTTGMPKGVTHTHLSYPFGHLTTAAWIGLKPSDIHFNISQPGWAKYAYSSFFAPLSVGATVFAFVQGGKFTAKANLEALEKFKITTFCAPPTVFRLLILEDLKQYVLALRECVSAGEPLNPEVISAWKKGTNITIRDGYGQTESTLLVCNLPNFEIRYGSMGKPTFLYDIAILNEEGLEQATGEEGHIAVRVLENSMSGIFKEYFAEPQRMKEVVKNGFYYTGDKAYKDEQGFIWFVGRDDDVIKASDYRVGPFEVESVLIDFPEIIESAVVASPHPLKGFEVKAFVILNVDTQPDTNLAKEIFAFCRKNLAPYKAPRILEFVKELPKTISGKIRRVELRAKEAYKKANQEKGEFEYFYEEVQGG